MSRHDLRLAFVTSTDGSVMNEVLKNDFVRSRTHLVIADHEGPGAEHGREHGVPTFVIEQPQAEGFSAEVLAILRAERIDYVLSFYTQFFSEELRSAFEDRILNFHPSLLPAFKGLDGFGDTVAYPARFAGNTVEFIADVMDEGKVIMQTVCPVDTRALVQTRHHVFVQQCKALVQVVHWLQDGRIDVDGHVVTVRGATFDDPSFSPALDAPDAVALTPPDPPGPSE